MVVNAIEFALLDNDTACRIQLDDLQVISLYFGRQEETVLLHFRTSRIRRPIGPHLIQPHSVFDVASGAGNYCCLPNMKQHQQQRQTACFEL